MIEKLETKDQLAAALHNLVEFCELVFVKPAECDDLAAAKAALARYDDENSVDGA